MVYHIFQKNHARNPGYFYSLVLQPVAFEMMDEMNIHLSFLKVLNEFKKLTKLQTFFIKTIFE